MGMWSVGVPVVCVFLGVGAVIRHLWIPAAIIFAFAAFAVWLIARYDR